MDSLDFWLRPTFAIAAVLYLLLAVRVARASPQHANSVIAFFLLLVGMLVAGSAFSYGTEDENIFGIGRVLAFFASGFIPIALYVVYREYTEGKPSPLLLAIMSIIPIATTLLALTNASHNMIWSSAMTADGIQFSIATEHYWFNRVHAPFLYGLFGFTVLALIGRLPTIAPAHRQTVGILLACAVLPFAVNFGNVVLGIGARDFPFTAVALVLLLPVYAYASLSLRFYEFSPLAYQTLFDHVRDPILVLDDEQRIICANRSAQELLDASEKDLIGHRLWEDFPEAKAILQQANELDLTQTLRLRSDKVYEISVAPLSGPRGQSVGMVVVCRDVTERRRAQTQLAESEQLIRTLIETSSNGILRFSREEEGGTQRFRCVFANPAAQSYLGETDGGLIGKLLNQITRLQPQRLIEHFENSTSTVSFEVANDMDGSEAWLRIVGESVGDDFSITLIDITQRKHDEDRMLAEALRDPLTGVLNRRGFEKEGVSAVRQASKGAVLYLDLNQFKSINDRFGHPAGDALLKAFGHRLEFCLRPEDVLGRLGGDEFAIVLPGVSVDDAQHVASRLIQTAHEAYIIQGQEIRCTASVGIALMPEDGEELWHLISVADEAMYHDKHAEQDEAANDQAANLDSASAN